MDMRSYERSFGPSSLGVPGDRENTPPEKNARPETSKQGSSEASPEYRSEGPVSKSW
jgi:hypothetical protein